MKAITAIALVLFGAVASARAQWIVYDPTMNVQQIIDTAQQIAKFAIVINNQVQQIQTLTSQLTEFKRYEVVFGTPAIVSIPTAQPLITDLTRIERGQPLVTLQIGANAGQGMLYNNNGLYRSVGTQFTTPGGQSVTRPTAPYLPVAAVQKTTDNYQTVSTDAGTRRAALKQQIATTTQQLQAATTDAEVQKLHGVLVGLSAALNGADQEIHEAAASSTVQEIANRNDQKRQLQADRDQQNAEFTETVQKYGQTFRLLNAPSEFPTN